MPAPIPFADPRRCDGIVSPTTKRPVDPCTLCPLRIEPAHQSVYWIAPDIYETTDAQGRIVKGCRTREGLHDGAHCAPTNTDQASLDLGKVGTTSGVSA